ncbi:MAG: RDD family protein, partial [Planctomycetaceae bacterium]|nr:RDD family protein [Planctomycetaceae bacterium]
LYYVFMEAVFQRSLGKLVTGTMVVAADGSRPSFGKILGRSFARIIPFEAFSFLGSKTPTGWHDTLSGTRVVKTR